MVFFSYPPLPPPPIQRASFFFRNVPKVGGKKNRVCIFQMGNENVMIDRGRNFDEYVQYEDPEKVFRKAFEEYRDQMLEFLVLPLSKIEDEILYSFSEKSKEFVFVKKENYGDKEIDVYYLDLTNEYAKQLHDYVISHRKIFGKTRKIFLESKNSNGTFLIMNHVEYKDFCITRVVTRDFIRDWFQGIRSMFGMRMKAYEKRTKVTIQEIMEEVKSNGTPLWHRMNIQEVGKDGILINIYGEYK